MKGFFLVHPFHGPLSFFFDDINVLNGIEKVGFLILVLDVSVDKEWVSLGMDVFHGDLEAVKASGLRDLNFSAELLSEIFHDDTITGCKESEYIFDEMFLVGVEFLPVSEILDKIDFLSSPERGKMFFVHVIDWGIMDGEENKAMVVLFEDRLEGVGSGEWLGVVHGRGLWEM